LRVERLIHSALGAAALILSGFLLYGCFSKSDAQSKNTFAIDSAEYRAACVYNKHLVDSAVSMLHTGNIVLRMGHGADSKLLSELNARDKSFSHCGIVMAENGYPFVYHSIGGEDNPDERLRRDSASFFFSQLNNSAIAIVHFDFKENDVNELRQVVSGFYKSRPRFDMKFDLSTDDQLYCSEFVYKAINKAMKDTSYIAATTLLGHRFVGIDDIFMNDHANIVWRIKYK
jgi:Permuted papain-like amidase enzyme, YaeF/YiiX, C92 family